MKQTINWGILGTARIARDRFLPGLMEAEHAHCYAIAGRKPEKLQEFEERFHPDVTYTSYEALLDDPDVDAVYIPLPNHLHKEWVLKAAAKKKHILCEKPLGLTTSEILEMKEAACENGVLLTEAFAYLHGDCMEKVSELIAAGTIGEIRHIDVRFQIMVENMGMGKAGDIRYKKTFGGGVTYDLGCYALSFMRSVLGEEPEDIQALARFSDSGIDEHVSMNCRFPSGRTGTAFVSFDSFYEQSRTIVGDKGTIIIPFPYNFAGEANMILNTSEGSLRIPVTCRDHYGLEAEELSLCILHGKAPKVSLDYSYENQVAIEKVLNRIGY